MDGNRFDNLTKRLAGADRRGLSRRAVVTGAAAGLLAAFGTRRSGDAQVTQAYCGNKSCKNNPGKCKDGCVCCDYANGNSRCQPPGTCSPGNVACPAGQRFCPDLGRCAECCAAAGCATPSNTCQTATCDGGVCGNTPVRDDEPSACPDGHVCCGGGCTPLGTAENCGACGDACDGPGESCGGGGTTGVCGCTPTTCFEAERWCGSLDDGCGNVLDCGDCSTCPDITLDEPGCFHLNGYLFGDQFCWVPAERHFAATTREACRALDSCEEGGGGSGGGCYKWAMSSDTVIAPPW